MLPEHRRIKYCKNICHNIKDESDAIGAYKNIANQAPDKIENAIILAISTDEKKHFELLRILANRNNCNCGDDS